MSLFKIKAITINQQSGVIRLTRSLFFNNDIGECITPKNDNNNNNVIGNNGNIFYIPDEIFNKESIEIIDSIESGSTLLYPYKFKFPNDLIRLKNHRFKIQMIEGSHVIGKFIDMIGDDKVEIDVEEFHSYKNSITIPVGRISLKKDHIQSYFPLNQSTKDNNEKLTKIIVTNTSQSREILVCYDVSSESFPSTSNWSDNMGAFTHYIKGIQSHQIYTNPNLLPNIPITITTEFKWIPLWDIPNTINNTNNTNNSDDSTNTSTSSIDYSYGGNGIIGEDFHSITTNNHSTTTNSLSSGVTLTIISNEKYKYTIENVVCFKNYENKIKINRISTTCTRAAMVYPSGPIEIVLYFENNSNLSLTKSPISLVGDDIIVCNDNNNNNNNINNNNNNNNRGFKQQQPIKPTEKPRFIFGPTNQDSKGFELLKSVTSNSIGIITFKTQNNDKVLIYKDIAHQPLWETKTRDFSITEIKVSTIFTLMDAKTSSKIKYQFVNATPYKTKYIVNTSSTFTSKSLPPIVATTTTLGGDDDNDNDNENNKKDTHGSSIDIDYKGWGEKIGDSLYLFDSSSLSINNFEITFSSKKQLMTHQRLPQVVINYLLEKGISIKYNPNKFEIYDLSNLDRNTQDTLLKLMNTLSLEEKTSNYFNKPHSNFITHLFENGGGFGGGSFNRPQGLAFGTTQQQPSFGGGFGIPQQSTSSSLFGSVSQPQQTTTGGGLFGSASQPQQPTTGGGLFGSSIQQSQQQQPQPQTTGLFGLPQPSSFGGFGQQVPPQPFGSATQQPSANFSGFGQQTQSQPFGSAIQQPTFSYSSYESEIQSQPQSSFGTFGSQTPPPSSPSSTPSQPATATATATTSPQPTTTATTTATTSPHPTTNSVSPFSFGGGNSLFGSSQPTSTSTTTPPSFSFGGVVSPTQTNHEVIASISASPLFSNKSVEEIRNDDNKIKNQNK